MLNFTKQLCRSVTVKEAEFLLRSTTPTFSLHGPPIIIKRCHHSPYHKKSLCTSYYMCVVRTFIGYLSPWFILRKIGIPCRHIISFRRGIKRFSFPWLTYSIPTALAMGAGDILAQMYGTPSKVKHVRDSKGHIVHLTERNISIKDLDLRRTAKFMLIGFFIMGPILSRWNRFINRRLSYNTPQMYLIKRTIIDVLILSPVLLIIGLAIWDYDHVQHTYPDLKPLWDKRLKRPFWEIMQFNLMTRPFMNIIIGTLIPCCLRKLVRRPYEVLFFAYVSSVIAKYRLGEKWRKPPPVSQITKKSWIGSQSRK